MKGSMNLVIRINALRSYGEPSFPHPPEPPDRDRLVVWVTGGLLSLFRIAFITALWRNDADLLNKVLPPLIAFVTLALYKLLKEAHEDDGVHATED
jgi:hypothetical protein